MAQGTKINKLLYLGKQSVMKKDSGCNFASLQHQISEQSCQNSEKKVSGNLHFKHT
jgi:hypothetical protein